ncbi:MAG: hypothetical protein GC201_10720 [Alphaproteobacteria bacterium]|nr:hypothetical protein [Alphaproteobacteria bacterium]
MGSVLAHRGGRLMAVWHVGRAVAAFYGTDEAEVLRDAARFAGERRLADVPPDLLKPVLDYLCGRLLVPEARANPPIP